MLGVGINLWRTSLTHGGVIIDDRVIAGFRVTAPADALMGDRVNFVVTAIDQHGAVYDGYAGIVHFTSSDGTAVLPPDTILNSFGVGVFPATFHTIGAHTLTATDTVATAATGVSAPVDVTAAVTGAYLQLLSAAGYIWLTDSASRIKLAGT